MLCGSIKKIKFFLTLTLSLFVIFSAYTGCLSIGDEPEPESCETPDPVSYSQHIYPLVNKNCSSCHGSEPQAPATKELFDSTTAIDDPGAEGTLIDMYDPSQDPKGVGLIQRLEGSSYVMPPDGKLSGCDVLYFKAWQSGGFQP